MKKKPETEDAAIIEWDEEIRKRRDAFLEYANRPAKYFIRLLPGMIERERKESADGIARIDVPHRHRALVCDYLAGEMVGGRIKGFARDINPLIPRDAPADKAPKFARFAVFPNGWKLPVKPKRVRVFNDDDDEAYVYAERQRKNGFIARVMIPGRKDAFPDNEIISRAFSPCQMSLFYKSDRSDEIVVEVWTAEDFLKYLATTFTQTEILETFVALLDEGEKSIARLAVRQMDGAGANKTRAETTAAEQRELFRRLREKYPADKVSKDWLIREKLCGAHPRKPGWKMRTVIANLKGLK